MSSIRRPLAFGLLALLAIALLPPPADAGWWRFEGVPGNPVGVEPNAENPGTLDGTGAAGATYSPQIPGPWITNPLLGMTYANTSSLAIGSGQGLVTVLDDPYFDTASSFTIEAFVRQGTSPSAGWDPYVRRRYDAGGGSYRGWQLDKTNSVPNPTGRARIDTSSAQNQVVQAGTLTSGTWRHTALTYDATNGRLSYYVDYTTFATATLSGFPGTSSQLSNIAANLVMGSGAASWGTSAAIDEVRFTPAVLNPSQHFLRAGGLPINYTIQVGAPTSNASVTGYYNTTLSTTGTQFVTGNSGSGTTLNLSGTVPLRLGLTDYLQFVVGAAGTPTLDSPYFAALFTAPPGYVFSETGNQYLTTVNQGAQTGPWWASNIQWGNFGHTHGDGYVVVPRPTPPGVAGFPVPTAGIWGVDGSGGYSPYLDVAATLVQGAWTVPTNPVSDPGTSPGISARIARVNNDLNNLTDAATALALTPGQTNFNASQIVAIPRADLDAGGNFASPAGYFSGDHQSTAGNPEDYAVRLAGYLNVQPGNLTHTFALSSDDQYSFTIGGVQYLTGSYASPPNLVQLTFPSPGFYPFEVLARNRGGPGFLEVSSMPGYQTTFSAATFALLGTDPNLPVVQDPAYVPGATLANTAGSPVFAGSINPVADGLRVQQAYPASHGGSNPASATDARNFFATKVIQNGNQANYNVGVVAWDPANPDTNLRPRTRLDMNDTTSGHTAAGNLSPTDPIPLDNYNTSYTVQSGVANDNYVTRMNGLLYIDQPGLRSFTVSSDDGYYLRIGNQLMYRTGSGGITGGSANYMYANFTQPGLYPFEFYQYEGTGGSGFEIGRGGSTNLLLTTNTRNPSTNGFSTDFTNLVYRAEPVAELKADSTTLKAKAFANVPALGMQVNPEQWILMRQTPDSVPGVAGLPIQGLRGTYYDFAFNQSVNNTWPPIDNPPVPVLGYRNDLNSPGSVFNFGGGFASALVPSRPGSPTNPAGANDYFGVRWQGFINIPRTGFYSFQMQADDRGWMFIDLDGDLAFEPGEYPAGQPVVWSNWMQWNNVYLTQGLHWAEFRSREWTGGETATFQWMMPEGGGFANIPGEYFLNVQGWEVLAYGYGSIGDLTNFGDLMWFPYGTSEYLRLTVMVAGLTAVYEGQLTFVPEPATLVLLAGGLVAAAHRRRRTSRQ